MKKELQPAFDFLEGKISVDELMQQADEGFYKALQTLVPEGTTRCIQEIKNGELISHTVPYDVKSFLTELHRKGTLDAKVNFFSEIRDILTTAYPDVSVDDSIIKKFRFILSHTPSYIGGVEAQKVLEDIYDQMKVKKPKLYKEKVKELFVYESKPPRWIQEPEWPVDIKGGVPLKFLYMSWNKRLEEAEYFFQYVDSAIVMTVKQNT